MEKTRVQALSFPAASDEAVRWRDLRRRWGDWRMVWGGAFSMSVFLCLGGIYTFVKLHDNPDDNIPQRDLWLFQILAWLGMVAMALVCVIAQRRTNGAEEDMAQMLVAGEGGFTWDVTQLRWDRFKAGERRKVIRVAWQLSPLIGGVVVVALISIASVLYDTGLAELVFAVTISMELMLGTMCLLWFVHAQVYRLGERRESVHVVLLASTEDDGFGHNTTNNQLYIVMGDRLASASQRRQIRMRRSENATAAAPSEWELFVDSFAFPVADGEEEFIWSRLCTIVNSGLPQ